MSIVSDYFSFQNGYAFKSKDFVRNGKYAIIRIKELKDGGVKFFEDTARTNPEDSFNINKYIVKKGDVLFALTGDPVNKTNPLSWVGRVSYYNHDTPALLNQRVCKAIPKNKVSNEFLYYFFRQNEEFYNLASKATGSASQANISTKTIEQHIMEIPDEDIRKKIVFMLLNIDMKIDVNNRINDNLEQQIITIFDKLFSDLIIDKSLFVPMGEIADFKYGTMPKKDKIQETGYPIFSGYKIVGYYPEKMFENPQLIIVARGVGGCGDVKFTPKDCYLTNLSIAIIPSDLRHELYMFYYLKQQDMKILNTGSAQPQITISSLANYNIPIPNIEDIETFNSFAVPFVEMVRKNEIEIKQLSNLRDFLLPRLMSGEIDISDIHL